jgi:hypothetical protein
MQTIDYNFLYSQIEAFSISLHSPESRYSRELGSAKNYVCTPDLKYWTFGKTVGEFGHYHFHGGIAKSNLYRWGFINVLHLPDSKIKDDIIKAFINWASMVKVRDVVHKFTKDQESDKRFELLVHKSVIATLKNKPIKEVDTSENQEEFDEGFTKEIIFEVKSRNSKLVSNARIKYGTKCTVCEFDFGVVYGLHGAGFIELHHLYPISEGRRKSTIDDLRPVCANCHRMLHRGKQLLSIDRLKKIIQMS